MSSQELMKVSDIPSPTISGSVKMPLAEVDKLRADYLTAVKLAQDLEEKQTKIMVEVRIPFTNVKRVIDRIWDPHKHREIENYRVESFQDFTSHVDYKGLEEVLPRLKKEAEIEVEAIVANLTRKKSEALKAQIKAENELHDYKDQFDAKVKELEKNAKDYKKRLLKRFKETQENNEILVEENGKLAKEISNLTAKHTVLLEQYRRLEMRWNDSSFGGIWRKIFG